MIDDINKIDVRSLTCGNMEVNTYIIVNGKECIIIDPAEFTAVNSYVDCMELKIKAVLLTHGHFDHTWAASDFQKRGIPIYIHEGDAPKCRGDEMGHYIEQYGLTPFEPDILFSGDCDIELIGLKIKVLHTPGHSKGGLCYIIEDCMFSGDTLFRFGFGRYDFFDGSLALLKKSITRLFNLEGEYKVYPGHGKPSELSRERRLNAINQYIANNIE